MSYGPITWRCRIESREPGRDRLDLGDDAVGVGVELVAVRLVGPLVRHPLREHRHTCLPSGASVAVEHRRDADVGERARGGPARDRVLERLLDVVEDRREHDRAAVDVGIEARARR